MRERAAHHPHLTDGMRDAMAVFDEWLYTYKEPSEEERRDQRKEWEAFHKLCQSDANQQCGKHTINPEDCTSQVYIDSLDGIEELLGRAKTRISGGKRQQRKIHTTINGREKATGMQMLKRSKTSNYYRLGLA